MKAVQSYSVAFQLANELREKYSEAFQVTLFPSAWYDDYFEVTVRDLHNYDPRPHDLPLSFADDVERFVMDFNSSHVEVLVLYFEGRVVGPGDLYECVCGGVLPLVLEFHVVRYEDDVDDVVGEVLV